MEDAVAVVDHAGPAGADDAVVRKSEQELDHRLRPVLRAGVEVARQRCAVGEQDQVFALDLFERFRTTDDRGESRVGVSQPHRAVTGDVAERRGDVEMPPTGADEHHRGLARQSILQRLDLRETDGRHVGVGAGFLIAVGDDVNSLRHVPSLGGHDFCWLMGIAMSLCLNWKFQGTEKLTEFSI